MSYHYRYHIVKFKSITDNSSSYRFVLCPGNITKQVMAISGPYEKSEDAIAGIHKFQLFADEKAAAEFKAVDFKSMPESDHLKIWQAHVNEFGIPYYMFEIRCDGVLLTSAHDYEHKRNCIDGLKAVLEHSQAEIESLDDPEALNFRRKYFNIK